MALAGDMFRKSAQDLESAISQRERQVVNLKDQALNMRQNAEQLMREADQQHENARQQTAEMKQRATDLEKLTDQAVREINEMKIRVGQLKHQATAADDAEKLIS